MTSLHAGPASGERTISLYHIHTKETLTITFKRNGQFIPEAMKQIDWLMRDWRLNQSIEMDPVTVDLLWEMHTELGSKEPIHIICGYRSRGTNNMLRRTRGGQASNSQHITGKAIDAAFPDIPLKKLRYSALVRERGGVGYYPTSGIPFIHVDTGRVRMWPRMPNYELALLFPNGRTKYGSISKADVETARSRYRDVAQQVAEFHEQRARARDPQTTLVAAVSAPPKPAVRQQQPVLAALTPPREAPQRVEPDEISPEALGWKTSPRGTAKPAPGASAVASLPPPKLIAPPRLVERPSRFAKGPTRDDRSKLDRLVTLAANEPMPKLIAGPRPVVRPPRPLAPEVAASEAPPPARVAALDTAADPSSPQTMTDALTDGYSTGWAQAPQYDDDHPEDLAYAPFPLTPLVTDTASIDDPALARMQHHNVAKTLELLDDDGVVLPMRLRQGEQVTETQWAQQFQGKVVDLSAFSEPAVADPSGLASRNVKTVSR